jgi:amino acid adenylation domain-containing protein
MKALLQDWVTQQAEHRPDAIALVMNQERLTYRQLEETTNQLARLLKDAGCKRGERVCFLTPKSPAAIISLLGILKADCMHVPLDPASPAPRIARIVESCANRWILSAGPVGNLLDDLMSEPNFRNSISVGWMESEKITGRNFQARFSAGDLCGYPSGPVDCQNNTDDGAHILFTSGSTGTPKGVVITHGNVIHFVEWAVKYFGIGPSDRNSCHPPLYFDLSQFDIFGSFAVGAQLHLVSADLSLLPHKLADLIRSSELTQWFSVPSALNYMAKFDVVKFDDFPALKRLLWCGEVLPTPTLQYWMKRLPHVTFTNLYGPTETTIASSHYTLRKCPADERQSIPIGTACDGEDLLVLDENLIPPPPGEPGDLYIGGVGLSPGYWRDPEKTRSAFIQRPGSTDPSDRIYKTGDIAKLGADGLVYYLGRVDSQIKSRGYRIELGEIEAALSALGELEESAVVAIPSRGFEGVAICCAYVAGANAQVSPAQLCTKLSKLLPGYMLPSRWMAFERLPRSANGKTDRPHLRKQFQENAAQPA